MGLLAASIAAPTVGGIIGNIAASGDQDQAKAALQQALQNIQNVNVPSISQQEVNLDKEKSAGQLSPEMLGALSQGNSGLANISADPRLRSAQMQALASLQQQGQTGLNATDRQALNEVLNKQNQTSGSANAAVLQNMAARGMGGSGATLAAQLANNQNSANNAQQAALQIAGQAQQNALNATAQSGQLGSSLEGQQYGEAANAANAQDVINRFNAQNAQQVASQNVGAKNYAQQANLSNAQGIANTNTGLQNQQQFYNKGLYQQQFNNNMSKAGAEANALGNQSNYYGNQANAQRGMWSGIGSGIGQGAATMGAYNALGNAKAPSTMSATDGNNFGAPQLQMNSGSGYHLNAGGQVPSDLGIFKYLHGGTVDGPEIVPGDSPKNDIVPARLSAGEVVLPKEIAQSDNDDVILAFIRGVKTANKGKK